MKVAIKICAARERGLQLLALEVADGDDVGWVVEEAMSIAPGIVVISAHTQLPEEPLDRPGWHSLFADIRRRIVPACRVVPNETGRAH